MQSPNPGGLLGGLLARFGGQSSPAPAPTRPAAPQSPAALVELVNRRYRWSRQSKESQLRTWATCLAFYSGDQYRTWNKRTRQLVEPQRLPSWRVLLTDNQIPGAVELAAAKLARSRDMPTAQPNTQDPEDVAAAQAGTKALAHWWHVDDMDSKELEANVHRLLFGAAFYHDYWDPYKLAKVPVQGPMGQMTSQRAPVGDVCVEVLSVFDVFPEPAEKWSDIRWCIVARRKPISWFQDTFGDAGRQVQADKGDADSVFESLLPSSSNQTAVTDAPQGDGYATLKVYYEAPCPSYPQGRHFMVAGDTLLFQADELPMPHGEIPLSMKGFRLVPKRLWPLGLVESLLGQQRELNRVQSYMLENLRLHGRPQRLVPREAKVDKDNLTSSPDEIVEYNALGGAPPSYLAPPTLPAWIQELPVTIRTAIQQLAGQHEVSNASVPAGVTAASAIRMLIEQDDTRLAVAAALGKHALEVTSRHILTTMVERWREPRLIATLGKGQVEGVMALMGSDIGDRDVLVNITEGAVNTEAFKSENFRAYWQLGIFQQAFQGAVPPSFVVEVLQALGEEWMAEAFATGMQEQQQMQMQQALQQQQLAAEQQAHEQGMAETQAGAQSQQAALQAGQQQEQAAQQQAEAEAQRQHELELAQMKMQGPGAKK